MENIQYHQPRLYSRARERQLLKGARAQCPKDIPAHDPVRRDGCCVNRIRGMLDRSSCHYYDCHTPEARDSSCFSNCP